MTVAIEIGRTATVESASLDLEELLATRLLALREGSVELRNAHLNLQNIRRALARPDFRPR